MSTFVEGHESRLLMGTKVDKRSYKFLAGLGQFYDI